MSSLLEPELLFDDLIGQSLAVSMLQAVLLTKRIAPAYLFSGAEGVGRGLAALRFLEGVLTGGHPDKRERRRLKEYNHPDLLWVEPTYLHKGKLVPASNVDEEGISRRSPPQIRLEQIRGVTEFVGRQPIESSRGMVVIESVEAMAESASNALLKTLEEPGNGLLILLSTNPERLLPTIKSRCQKIPFNRLDSESFGKVLAKQIEDENSFEGLGIDQSELFALAGGSPGALLHHLRVLEEIPKELFLRLRRPVKKPLEAMTLARDLTEELNGEQQLWMLDRLQQHLWRKDYDPGSIRRLDRLRIHLRRYVQPRLAWEVALLEIVSEV